MEHADSTPQRGPPAEDRGRVIEGKSLAQIGREEGVSRQTIWKQLGPGDARQIIVALTNREIDRISVLFNQMLQVIGEGLSARHVRIQDGAVVDLGPDHCARLTAVSRLMQVLTAGRPVAKAAEERKRRSGDGALER